MIQNRTAEISKNVIEETAIKTANFIGTIYFPIMIDTLLLRPLLKLHYTSPNYTSLHFTQLHFTTVVDTSLLPI